MAVTWSILEAAVASKFQLPNGAIGDNILKVRLDLRDKMFTRIRRSFRKKKDSHCFNCNHTNKECYHKEYENISFKSGHSEKSDKNNEELLKWLDLDQINKPNNLRLSRQRQHLAHLKAQQRPHSVYNEYSNFVVKNGVPILELNSEGVRKPGFSKF